MPFQKGFIFSALLPITAMACGCQPSAEKDPIDFANSEVQAHVANDVTLTFNRASERVYHPAGMSYSVCGMVEVNQPGFADHLTQRFVIPINEHMGGVATFDGSDDPNTKKDFEALQRKLCT